MIPAIRLSKKSEYAIRALLHMASVPVGQIHSLHELCKKENLPIKFVEQALSALKNAGMVTSRRGARGGYMLAIPPERILIGDILSLLEGVTVSKEKTKPQQTLSYRAFDCFQRQVSDNVEAHLCKRTLREVLDLVPVTTAPDFMI